jgi:undecaprenyl-diphosphatase
MNISFLKHIALLICLAAAAAFFSADMALNIFAGLNLRVSELVQDTINAALTPVLFLISATAGDWPMVIMVTVICILVWWRWGSFDAIFLVAAAYISRLNEWLKLIFNTTRPSADQVHVMVIATSPGFPSGHSFFSVIFYGFIAYLALKNMRKPWSGLACAVCAFIILAVGYSRIYLGVHWFSDVIGGYLFGGFCLAALIWLYDYLKNKYKKAAGSN